MHGCEPIPVRLPDHAFTVKVTMCHEASWARLVARCKKPKIFTKVCRLLLHGKFVLKARKHRELSLSSSASS